MNKLKVARCPRCGKEEPVKYKDRGKKFCRECAKSEGILELMYLVPARFIDPEDAAVLETDYKNWTDENGSK